MSINPTTESTQNEADLETMLAMFADGSASIDVRMELASNPNTPAEVLAELSTDMSFDVIDNLVWNPSMTTEMLDTAYRNLAWTTTAIETALAMHQNASEWLLDAVSRSDSTDVRIKVVGNPNTSPARLRVMQYDPNRTVSAAARAHPNFSHPEALPVEDELAKVLAGLKEMGLLQEFCRRGYLGAA
ncbi:hypothetical protein ACWG8W_06115 [Citricoccus zhacaiensis]